MTTLIPAVILLMLGNPNVAEVQTQIYEYENIICWSRPSHAVCFNYTDDGETLRVHLQEQM